MPHKPYDFFLVLKRPLYGQPNEQHEGSVK